MAFEKGLFDIFMNRALDEILYHPNDTVKKCAGIGGKSSFKTRFL